MTKPTAVPPRPTTSPRSIVLPMTLIVIGSVMRAKTLAPSSVSASRRMLHSGHNTRNEMITTMATKINRVTGSSFFREARPSGRRTAGAPATGWQQRPTMTWFFFLPGEFTSGDYSTGAGAIWLSKRSARAVRSAPAATGSKRS